MAGRKAKWKFIFLINIILLSVFTKSLPLQRELQRLKIVDSSFIESNSPELPVITITENAEEDIDSTQETPTTLTPLHLDEVEAVQPLKIVDSSFIETNSPELSVITITENAEKDFDSTPEIPTTLTPLHLDEVDAVDSNSTVLTNATSTLLRKVRPGQEARQYSIEITVDGRSFSGRSVVQVQLSEETRGDNIVFHARDLDVQSVHTGIFTAVNAVPAGFWIDDGRLEIDPPQDASNYIVVIEFTGSLDGIFGLYEGGFNGVNYIAMNLHATNARRVFPCLDELTEATTISFTFNDMPYNNVIVNSRPEDGNPNQYRPLQTPPVLWGLVAHNFNNINNPTANVQLHARPGVTNQENQASVAINYYFNNLEEWTLKPYTEIVLDQDGRMVVIALPDINRDWYALSTVCIWEPYLLMERLHSVKQRKEALTEISEAISRQWFGYVIYPENWRYQWVVTGLASYAAYDLNKEFQSTPENNDVTLIDFHSVFLSDVIQEALYRDAYSVARPLDPGNDLYDEAQIRDHIYGLNLLKYKAPAVLWMMNLVLGDEENDFIKRAAQVLVQTRSLDSVNTLYFLDAIKSDWLSNGNGRVEDLNGFVDSWVRTNGYPAIHVGLWQGGVILTQQRFGFSSQPQIGYQVPITWTTSINPNFDMENARNIQMVDGTLPMDIDLGDDDFVLFNIQGQGYYRVNYDSTLWGRIIAALGNPEQREKIHPLNRATLLDDALNLARAGLLDYDIALQVVLTMEHEIEYPVWKAFVRNMNFLKKRLLAYVNDEEDRDPDIFLRIVRRTVRRVENELGFYPDITGTEPAMESLTRGLVMDHACRANYQPCIAAAVDWFYDPDIRDERVVNPNIPHEIRPAVYCTMVREGDRDVINALYDRLEIEPVMYERIVIIESLACSRDTNFVRMLLEETTATSNNPWTIEERSRIFSAVVESSFENVGIAMNFMSSRTEAIRRAYGGPEKLEQLIWILAENMANDILGGDFNIWVTSINSDLADSEATAVTCNTLIKENQQWINNHLENVYDWIEENDAPTLAASLLLIFISFSIAFFNY